MLRLFFSQIRFTLFTIVGLSLLSLGFFFYEKQVLTPQVFSHSLMAKEIDSFIFIDVRTPQEYKSKHIPKSILVPLQSIQEGEGVKKIEEIAQKNQQVTLILYCTTGPRSIWAYQRLEKSKLRLQILGGGIMAWEEAGMDIEK